MKSISKDERERAHFRSRRMFLSDMESNLITAKEHGIEIGKKHGIEIGKKRGIEIGEKRGIEIGKKQRAEDRKETAINFKSKGVPMDVIVESMKLTPEEMEVFGLSHKIGLSHKKDGQNPKIFHFEGRGTHKILMRPRPPPPAVF